MCTQPAAGRKARETIFTTQIAFAHIRKAGCLWKDAFKYLRFKASEGRAGDNVIFAGKISIETRFVIAIVFLPATFIMVLAGFDKTITELLLGFGVWGALLAGAFYTFGITTPFSMVVILELMRLENPFAVAVFACIAAASIDCVFFSLVRSELEKNTRNMLEKTRKAFHKYAMLFPFAGFLVFGLPLPDELGLALMEMTEIRLAKLWVVIFLAKMFTLLSIWKALTG